MIDHKQYIKNATRTESVPEVIRVQTRLLIGALKMTVAASQVLDLVKKQSFYRNAPLEGDALLAQKTKDHVILGEAIELTDVGCGHIEVCQLKNDPAEEISIDVRVFHAIVGMSTETGEIIEALLNSLETGEPLDRVNLLEEIGDLNWYQAIAIDALNGDMQNVLDVNIAKLVARYPDKFTDAAATTRSLDVEREILEGAV